MATNKIQLIFEAIDRATSIINGIGGAVDNVGKRSGAMGSLLNGAFMGAGLGAFNAAMSLASSGLDGFKNNLLEAGKRQTEMIGSVGALAVVTEQPFSEATKQIDSLNLAITKNMAALPGATQAYKELGVGIIDNLVPAAKDFNNNLDPKKLQAITLELTRSFGLIGQGQGVSSAATSRTLSRAISGGSLSELKNLQLFEAGIGSKVLDEIKKQVIARGGQDLKDIDEKARIEIINAAGKKFITADVIKAYQESFEGALEGVNSFISNITDFGKKLTSRGGKTVLDAAGKVINSTVELFSTIARGLGFTDPEALLTVVYDMMTGISTFLNSLNTFAINIIGLFQSGSMLGGMEAVFSYFQGIGTVAGDAFISWADSVDWAGLLIIIGEVAIMVLTALGGLINGLAASIIPSFDAAIMSILATIGAGLTGMVMSAGESLAGFVSSITSALSSFFSNLGSQISSAVSSIDVGAIASGLAAAAKAKVSEATGVNFNTYSVQPMAMTGGRSMMQSFTPASSSFTQTNYINVSVGSASNDIATAVVEALDRKWTEYRQSYNVVAV